MILVDSSVWIDFLRGRHTLASDVLRRLVADEANLVTTEPVVMELLAGGGSDPRRVAQLERLTDGLSLARVEPHLDFHAAAGLYRAARVNGETVRSLVDCLIAAVAIRHGLELLHDDRDFEALARISPLRIVRTGA